MKKRVISLIIAAMMAAMLLIVPAALAEDNSVMNSAGYYYVYTENGKGLNVRNQPGGDVVGSLKYGSKIYCYYRDGGNGWALIDYAYDMPGVGYGTYACYISSRYLRTTKPPARPSGSKSSSGSSDDITAEINAEFRSAKSVTPFVIIVRPTRASGWANLRWAPSKGAELMATYKANDQLLVIKEMKNWYQVEDQDTGDVGFINKQFVVQ